MRWILFYSVAFLLGIIMAWQDWPFWIAILFLSFITFAFIFDMLYTIYGTTNMKRVEQFIIKKKKEPIYRYVYAQAFGTKDDQLDAIEKILRKYKQPHIKHYYQAIRAYLKEDYPLALQEASFINKKPLENYLKALTFAAMGDKDQALCIALEKNWMKEAILAMIAFQEKDEQAFQHHSAKAIEQAKGIQRFSLQASFRSISNR